MQSKLTSDGGGDRIELSFQVGAQGGHHGNDHHGDQGHQQAVLHGGGPGFVLEEISELSHGSLQLGASQLLQVSMANAVPVASASVSELFDQALHGQVN